MSLAQHSEVCLGVRRAGVALACVAGRTAPRTEPEDRRILVGFRGAARTRHARVSPALLLSRSALPVVLDKGTVPIALLPHLRAVRPARGPHSPAQGHAACEGWHQDSNLSL